MIITDQISLEMLIGPIAYYALIYILPPLFAALAAWWADTVADASLQNKERAKLSLVENPVIVDLTEIYEFEHISQPIIAGLLAGFLVVYPLLSTGLSLESAILLGIAAGLVSRKVLSSTAAAFVSNRKV